MATVAEQLRATPEEMEFSRVLKGAIIEDISGMPGGLMSYGEFAERSMNGYDTAPGYYTREDFRPNDYDGTNPLAGTIGTMAAWQEVGEGLGEVLAIELDSLIGRSPLTIVEVGAGDGKMMENMLKGAARELLAGGKRNPLHTIMIDRTPQLLDKQRERLASLRRPPAQSHFIQARIESLTPPILTVGAVINNELLDMLPFEVAADIGDPKKPGMMYISTDGISLIPTFAPAREEHASEAAKTLRTFPDFALHSFQPTLIPTLDVMHRLVDSGVILTMDYGESSGADVQICRNGVPLDLEIAFNHPGLFDISVTPDWYKTLKWAIGQFGEEAIEFQPMHELLVDTYAFENTGTTATNRFDNLSRTLAKTIGRELLVRNMAVYDALLVRK